jgi:uncharacterized protein (TIGR02145 family)
MRQIIFKKSYIVYTLLMLSGLAIVPTTNTSSLSYQTDVGVSFTFNPTLSVSISPSDLTISNLTPGTTDASNEISINVSTNNVYGYNLYATVGNSTHDSTNLTHANGIDTFTSISTTADLSNLATENTWGYTYSLDNGTTWSNHNGLPLYTTDNPTRLKKNTGPSEDTVNFKIAAKSSSTQPSGTYTNVINFTAITKPTPVTLADAYASEGKELYHGYYKMQDMTSTICEETEDIGSQLQVIDIRDDKVYWIAKLADGNCWMTQNLDLDLISNPEADNYIALTSKNTDLNDVTSPAYQDGYTTNEDGIITWLPERDTIAYNNLNSTTWQNDNNHPYSYDYLDANGNPVYPDSLATKEIAGNHGLSGNYYNWSAAVASNDSASASGDLSNSICSKGWKLPNTTSKEFGNLFVKYNIIETNVSKIYLDNGFNKMISRPLYIIRAGIMLGPSISYRSRGYYWSNIVSNPTYAYGTLVIDENSIMPEEAVGRYGGWSLRCLAR